MKDHIKILDFLRGFAALAVVLFHFSNSTMPTIKPNYCSDVFAYGKYGVQVFFVISGFVIPLSMMRSRYKISNFFNNLLRRFVRINPPSYVAILLSFVLYYAAIIIVKRPIGGMDWPGVNFVAILGNLTYTVEYLNTTWYNPVFWTLAIEFQFYILIGLILPLFLKGNNIITTITLCAIMAIGFIDFEWFFSHGSFFVLGILLFLKREKLIDLNLMILLSIVTVSVCFFQKSTPEFIFGLVTFIIILSGLNFNFGVTNFLGKISYSLYITHWAVGSIAEIGLKRIIHIHEYPVGKLVMLLVYTIIAIGFATLFYRIIEKPFIKYSKALKANRS